MVSNLITIDFETKDPYIGRKLGAGWVYGLNVPSHDFKVLGASISIDGGTPKYYTDIREIASIARGASGYIMHNAVYDLGCLKFIGVDISDKIVYDTKIMATLFDSTLTSYGLDSLAKKYLKLDKGVGGLSDIVFKHDLFPWLKKELNAKAAAEKKGLTYVRERPDEKKLAKFAYDNMELLQEVDPDGMAEYANLDVSLTYKLYKKFMEVDELLESYTHFSGLTIPLVECRARGVDIDLDRAREARTKLMLMEAEAEKAVYEEAGEEFNLFSSLDMPRIFDKMLIPYPRTDKGNASITTPWLEKQGHHKLCKLIVAARRVKKIRRDFIDKVLDIQEYTCPDAGKYGKIYPELNLLHARTGRFSSTNPNIQQIPARDPVYSSICRGIIIAPPGSGLKLYSLDYSNQEGRIQLHYAHALRCDGADEIVHLMKLDPHLDMHQKVADLANITRDQAKIVNLGVSYGMGINSLANLLELNTAQAQIILDSYYQLVPYLKQMSDKCSTVMKARKYIKTLGGRILRLEKPGYWDDGSTRTYHHLALNKLIQGSAADQIMKAMSMAHKEGIKVLFPVHDQIVMVGTDEEAERMHDIMVNAYRLAIPMVVDYDKAGGETWAEAGH